MTQEQLAKIERLEELNAKRTPGEWVKKYVDRVTVPDDTDGSRSIVHCYSRFYNAGCNAAFIAALASAADWLLHLAKRGLEAPEGCDIERAFVSELQDWEQENEGDPLTPSEVGRIAAKHYGRRLAAVTAERDRLRGLLTELGVALSSPDLGLHPVDGSYAAAVDAVRCLESKVRLEARRLAKEKTP